MSRFESLVPVMDMYARLNALEDASCLRATSPKQQEIIATLQAYGLGKNDRAEAAARLDAIREAPASG